MSASALLLKLAASLMLSSSEKVVDGKNACERLSVKEEVHYRQLANDAVRRHFEDERFTIYVQGVERCMDQVVIFFQRGSETAFKSTSKVVVDLGSGEIRVEQGE